jgi:integrase
MFLATPCAIRARIGQAARDYGRNVTRWFHELCARAGFERRRFHALRQSVATLVLAPGVPLEVISRTLGHSGYAITADVYAHVEDALLRTGAEAMDRALGSKRPGGGVLASPWRRRGRQSTRAASA